MIILQLGDIKHIKVEAVAQPVIDVTTSPTIHPDDKGRLEIKVPTSSHFYQTVLELCVVHGIKNIAFPAIPNIPASQAIQSVQEFLLSHPQIEKVVFCCYFTFEYTEYNVILNPGFLSKYTITL